MAETMTMNRVIHAAVRRDLNRLAAALEASRDGDKSRAQELQLAYENLHTELKHHHQQEDRHVFPALNRLGIDTALLEDMESEHRAMSDALDRAATVMQRYAATGSAGDAADARAAIREAEVVVVRHLDHEEDELEPLLRPHLESADWKQTEKALRNAPPTRVGRFFAWVTDGMDPESQKYLLTTIPKPVVVVFSKVFGRHYHRRVAPVWRSTAR